MPKDSRKNKRETGLEFLLPTRELLELSYLKDIIIHWGDDPSLILVGVDSLVLGEAFVDFIKKNSPLPVKLHGAGGRETVFDILRNADQLDAGTAHLLCFYTGVSLQPKDAASNLIFYRDYIPQFKLKIVLIASHLLLNTLIERAYDFYSISGFTGFFTDLSHSIQEDLAPAEHIPGPRPVQEFEKSHEDLNRYRQQAKVIPRVLMKKLFNSAGFAIKISRYDEALTFLGEALRIAKQIADREYQAMIFGNIGHICSDKGEFEKAHENYKAALKIFRTIGDSRKEARVLSEIGYIDSKKGELDKALKSYKKELEIAEMFGDLRGEAVVCNRTGLIYSLKGGFDEALKSHEEALRIFKELGDLNGQACELENIGNIHRQKGYPGDALEYLRKAFKIFRKNGDLHGEADTLRFIGSIFIQGGDLDKALAYLEEGLSISKKINILRLESSYIGYIGNIYELKGDIDNALKCFEEGLDISKKCGDLHLEASHLGYIGHIHELNGEYEEALKHYKEALRIAQKTGDFEIEVLSLGEIGILYLT
ncbi:MAG TPA: tetratricopeptide repeat protein, partial [Candidatus Kapabacteria bacterium]|nr:tetratricopeptide repeat protein [Candidatus Kapabacteria bacterium]